MALGASCWEDLVGLCPNGGTLNGPAELPSYGKASGEAPLARRALNSPGGFPARANRGAHGGRESPSRMAASHLRDKKSR